MYVPHAGIWLQINMLDIVDIDLWLNKGQKGVQG